MKISIKHLTVLFILLSRISFFCEAQNKTQFNHITVENGLSQSSVLRINQDINGFMWFNTLDGINRYDGKYFKVFRLNTNNDPNPISGSIISKIFSDENGDLFVLSDNCLSIYNPKTEKFEIINTEIEDSKIFTKSIATCIISNKFHQLIIGTNKGLFFLNLKSKIQFKAAIRKNSAQKTSIPISAIHEDISGKLWVSTSNGLGLFKRGQDGFYSEIPFPNIKSIQQKLSLLDIVCFANAPNGNLWIGTHFGGLFLFNPKNGTLLNYDNKISSSNIRKILIASDQIIWIGTLNGLFVLNPKNGKVTRYLEDSKSANSLNNNSIYDIFEDKIGNIWIGTYYGGINLIYAKDTKFNSKYVTGNSSWPSSKIISYLNEIEKGEIYVGTEAAGVDVFNIKNGTFTPLNQKLKNSKIQGNLIKVIHKGKEGRIWIGSQDAGLEMYDSKSNGAFRFFNTLKPHSETNPNAVYAVLEDSRKRFWVGSQRFGLLSFDKKRGQFKSVLFRSSDFNQHRFVKVIFEDSKQNIWFGTNAGLGLLKNKSKEMICFHRNNGLSNKLLSDNINCITEDKHGAVWIGTKHGGVSVYKNNKFETFDKSSGLPSDNVLGISEDKNGIYWISSDEGLSRFNYVNHQFINYSKIDGLPTNIFNNNSFLKSASGIFYFGTYNGLVSFNSDNIKINNEATPLVFLGLIKSNQSSTNKLKYQDYDQNLHDINEIKLKYNENTFTILFSLLNYIKSSKNRYEYKLEGFDKDWLSTDVSSATYTNLNEGSYRLLVKGANNDGFWSPIKNINITIYPPFWRSVWAYLIYVLILILLSGFIIQYIIIRVRLKQELKVNEMKMNFFMDISHELRTPLTLILGTVDQVLNKFTSEIEMNLKLNQVKINAQRLVRLVSELLDFRKAESGNMNLQIAEHRILDFSNQTLENFYSALEDKSLTLSFSTIIPNTLTLWFDDIQMEKVFFNLISNAIKFTPKGGEISFQISETENDVIIKITNSGIDIPLESRDKIFDDFYQIRHPKSISIGTGIGLALTRRILDLHKAKITLETNDPSEDYKDKFTRFIIQIKKGNAHFSLQEFSVETPYKNLLTNDSSNAVNKVLIKAGKNEKTKTILIAEDNPEIRELIKNGLNDLYQIIACNNGEDGLKMSLEKCPDLIISDVMMPIMDGISLCQKVKTDERTSHIPVILLTALSDHVHHVSGLEHGADIYMVKPFSMQLLALNINNILAARDLMRYKYGKKISLESSNGDLNELDEKFILKVVKLIEDNLINPDFSVSYLATSLFMNKNNLYKKIEALTNLSVNEFIKTIRLKKAAQLLIDNTLRVNEISFMVGFNDSQYFSREFKKQFGCSPKDFSSLNSN